MQHLPVDLVGRPEPQHLPGPVVDLLEHLLHLFVGHPGEVRPLREELPYEPARVLDCRLLPGVVRLAEVERHPSQRPAHLAVVGELLPPVRRHGLKRPARERPDLRLRDLGRAVRPGPAAHEQARRPVGHGDQACRGRADHGVVLPVAEPRARVGLARALGDLVVHLDPAARLLAPAPGAPAPAPEAPSHPLLRGRLQRVELAGVHGTVDGGEAHDAAPAALEAEPAVYLLGRPAVVDDAPARLGREGRVGEPLAGPAGLAAGVGARLGGDGPVAPVPAVPGDLPAHRGLVPAYRSGDSRDPLMPRVHLRYPVALLGAKMPVVAHVPSLRR